MTPEEIKMSEMSAELTLADRGLTRERVMALTGRQPRPAVVFAYMPRPRKPALTAFQPMECDDAPKTTEERHAAAIKAVAMVRSGMSARQALQRACLSECYASAVHECISGTGPTIDAARAGVATRQSKGVSFVRWYLDLPPINGADSPDNDRLRSALCKTGLKPNEIARRSGISVSTVLAFRSGHQPRMRQAIREVIFAALN